MLKQPSSCKLVCAMVNLPTLWSVPSQLPPRGMVCAMATHCVCMLQLVASMGLATKNTLLQKALWAVGGACIHSPALLCRGNYQVTILVHLRQQSPSAGSPHVRPTPHTEKHIWSESLALPSAKLRLNERAAKAPTSKAMHTQRSDLTLETSLSNSFHAERHYLIGKC